MASRLKEEERNEKAIRNLLKKTPNRRCINCNSLGPQYVCLNFWTFVCTQCSGIHREFTHRVKSVSMSKFSSQEVQNLENGGNERAREIYFKDWDSQRQPIPDSSNVDRLRDFIKMVYVEKRFSGERPTPRGRGGDRDESYDSRRPDPRPSYRADSRSPSYDDRYDERPSGGRRSNASYDNRYDDRGSPYDERRSPARFDNDRQRDDRSYRDSRPRNYDERSRYEDRYNDGMDRRDDRYRYDNRDRQQSDNRYNEGFDRRSEDRFANERGSRHHGGTSPPPVRSVKEILGDNVPPLRVETNPPQKNGGRDSENSQSLQDGHGQRVGSSSSFGSVDGNTASAPQAPKKEDFTSLIDFSAEPEPPTSTVQPDPFGFSASGQSSDTLQNSTGWASFDTFSAAPAPSTAQPPVSVASNLAASAPQPMLLNQGVPSTSNPAPHNNGNTQWTQWSQPSANSLFESNENWSSLGGQSTMPVVSQPQPWSTFTANSNVPNAAPSISSAVAPGMSTPAASVGVTPPAPAAALAPSVAPSPAPPPGSKHSSSRPEIPEDLFASAPQLTGPPHFGMPYSSLGVMNMVNSYNQPRKSVNPFDLPGDSVGGQVGGEFPNLTSLQASLPNVNIGSTTLPGLSLGGYSSQWGQPGTTIPSSQSLFPNAAAPSSGNGHLMGPGQQGLFPPNLATQPGSNVGQQNIPHGSLGPSPNSFGGADSTFSAFQNLPGLGQHSINGAQQGYLPGGQQLGNGPLGSLNSNVQPGFLPQNFAGSLNKMPGTDSFLPTQPAGGQHILGYGLQHSAQFTPQSSSGNPFG